MPKKTFEGAEEAGAYLVTQVKDNQESLRRQIEHGCRVQKSVSVYKDLLEKHHGRLEQRSYEVFQAIPMLKNWKKEWPYIRTIIKVERTRERLKPFSKPSVETSYYVTNAKTQNARVLAELIRSHWFIENKSNYVRDVSFGEDKGLRCIHPGGFSKLISFGYNIMRAIKCVNIKGEIHKNSLCFNYMIKNIKPFVG